MPIAGMETARKPNEPARDGANPLEVGPPPCVISDNLECFDHRPSDHVDPSNVAGVGLH